MGLSKIGGVTLEVVSKLSTKQGGDVTSHSVENGVDISDHAKQNNEEVDITALITGDDADTRLARLKDHQRRGRLVGVIGRTRHRNMYLKDISVNYEYEVSNGVAVDLSLQEVKIATAKKVLLNSLSLKKNTKTKPKTNGGSKQPSKGGKVNMSKAQIDKIAREVIRGRWGNGRDRVNRLTKAGHNASLVQARVNAILR